MNRLAALSCAAVAFLSLIGCGEDYKSIRNLGSRGETIICFGDSLTEGMGAGPGEAYPAILSQRIGFPVQNAGRSGDSTAQALARLGTDVLEKNPRLVVILLGGNDFLRQVPTRETAANLAEIVRRIQDHGAMVVIAALRLGLFTDEYGSMYEKLARQAGALYIPQVMKGILSDNKLKSDSIHPNAAGYRLLAERIATKVIPLLRAAGARGGGDGRG